ncbi:hypothetical protein ACEQ8H_005860 [Pleosporales sp. CAS-2024a]
MGSYSKWTGPSAHNQEYIAFTTRRRPMYDYDDATTNYTSSNHGGCHVRDNYFREPDSKYAASYASSSHEPRNKYPTYRAQDEPLNDYDEMFDAPPDFGRKPASNCWACDEFAETSSCSSRGASWYSSYEEASVMSTSGTRAAPMPTGVGRYKFPAPMASPHRSCVRGDIVSNSRQHTRSYLTREFRPSAESSTHQRPNHKVPYSSPSNPRRNTPPPPPPPPLRGIKPPTCFYTVLGISRHATPEQVKTAYRKMGIQSHPDRAADKDKARATANMAEINQAKDVLGDADKRRFYDRTGCVPGVCSGLGR